MIPFSLEEYNKNPNVPLVTRDGRPARIIATNGVKEYPICYVFEGKDGDEILAACDIHGLTGCFPMNSDLFMNIDVDLKPFGKVLIRDSDTDEWRPTFYWKTELVDGELHFYTTGGGVWNQCIPYNKGTSGLISTTNMPPEIYRIW